MFSLFRVHPLKGGGLEHCCPNGCPSWTVWSPQRGWVVHPMVLRWTNGWTRLFKRAHRRFGQTCLVPWSWILRAKSREANAALQLIFLGQISVLQETLQPSTYPNSFGLNQLQYRSLWPSHGVSGQPRLPIKRNSLYRASMFVVVGLNVNWNTPASSGPMNAENHSFRHSMRDRLRAVECPSDIIDQIGGWPSSSVGESYGEGYELSVLAKWMKMLEDLR